MNSQDFLDAAGRRPEWQADGLCAQTDPEAFYPEKGGTTRPAKRVCKNCPVKADCLAYALANRERFGIWGGLSERERRRLLDAYVRPQDNPVIVGHVLDLADTGISQDRIAAQVGTTRWTVKIILESRQNGAAA